MDSRLLAGAYSKRYKTVERDHIEIIRNRNNVGSGDVIAKARRMSQETNKRRKMAAQKRKQEEAREEKRRQEILNRRHQEQKLATEKFQRYFAAPRPHRPRTPSPTHNHMDLDEALRLIRGGGSALPPSSSSQPDQQSREAIQRLLQQQHTTRDPLERSYLRVSRAGSARPSQARQSGGGRPLSGRALDAAMRAELMERSLRNLASSRSRFEQQLEQHQQFLVEQQNQSLDNFNRAIRREIDADAKVQGMEMEDDDDASMHSLSSQDSLEEHPPSKPGSNRGMKEVQLVTQQRGERQSLTTDQKTVDELTNTHQSRGSANTHPEPSMEQKDCLQSQASHQPFMLTTGSNPESHYPVSSHGQIVGPIPQGLFSAPVNVCSLQVIQGNASHYSNPERPVAVGTALRLPQTPPAPPQPLKQPAPPLQYNSQLVAHRRFDPRPNTGAAATGSKQRHESENTRTAAMNNQPQCQTSALTENEAPLERPKAHVYAWASPPPMEYEQDWSQGKGEEQPPVAAGESSYTAGMVADRVMATTLHPHPSRPLSTAPTPASMANNNYNNYVNSNNNQVNHNNKSNKQPVYSHPTSNKEAVSSHLTSSKATTNHANPTAAHTDYYREQALKPGAKLTSVGPYLTTTGMRFVTNGSGSHSQVYEAQDQNQFAPPASTNHNQFPPPASTNQNQVSTNHNQFPPPASTNPNQTYSDCTSQQLREASIAQGTLGLVNGRLTAFYQAEEPSSQPKFAHPEPSSQPKFAAPEDESDGRKEVKGILKRQKRDCESVGGVVPTKLNVHDSVEITRKHMLQHATEAKKKKVRKKGVRFADLHYEDEVEDDLDSEDSLTSAKVIAKANNQKTKDPDNKASAARQRPSSARVPLVTFKSEEEAVSAQSGSPAKTKGPRATSAGPSRHPNPTRPRAAAHIIMSGDASPQSVKQASENSAVASGITIHKSQLEKKVTYVNNNFMSRIPTYVSNAPAPSSHNAPVVYTVTKQDGNGNHPSTVTPHYNGYPVKTLSFTPPGNNKGAYPSLKPSAAPPSHPHFTNANNSNHRAVYSDAGLRIDRTPTDDDINALWKNMRTMLDVNEGKAGTGMGSNPPDPHPRQQVHLSQQYIDGASLGIGSGVGARGPAHKASTPAATNLVPSRGGVQGRNGYLQRYSLLQQRRNPGSVMAASGRGNNGVVEQTVQPMAPYSAGSDPVYTAVNVSYAPREEMSESMAEFLAAEQMVIGQGGGVRESQVYAAMDSAQQQQEMYNSLRQRLAKGGPSAISMEEQQLLESLDRLNERLKVVDSRSASSNKETANPGYAQGAGLRGHQILQTPGYQRRPSASGKSSGRPTSSRLLTRPYH